MRKIEKQIIDIIRYDRIGSSFGVLKLSCRDAVIKDDDGWIHILLHDVDIAKISPYRGLMRINLQGYGTPTTLSRIRALLEYFAEEGFVLTRDPKLTYEDTKGWRPHTRGEPLLLSPCGQRVYIRKTEVLVRDKRILFWRDNYWEEFPFVG